MANNGTRSLPPEYSGRESDVSDEEYEQRCDVHPVRAPPRSIPHSLEQRYGVGGRECQGQCSEDTRQHRHWKEQTRHSQHWIKNERADRLGESRRRYEAGEDETKRQNAERAEQYS